MAGEATHVILAEKALDTVSGAFPKPAFVMGTLFPDIRYLGTVERDATHIREIVWADILVEADPFLAGAKFHSLVDKVRNEFMNARGMYDQCPPFLYDQQSLKLLEDELFYPLFPDWPRVVSYLRTTTAGPEHYGVSGESTVQWYALMGDYLSNPPSDASRSRMLEPLGFTKEAVILINAYVDELKKQKAATDIMRGFFEQFPQLIGLV